MNVQDEIKALKERIVELEEIAKEEEEFPYYDEDYWFVDSDTEVIERVWYGDDEDRGRLSIDNIYKTKEQAEFEVEKLKVEAELRKFSVPMKQGSYYIYIRVINSELGVGGNANYKNQGSIYFASGEKAEEAIETVGADRIKKYIFGVED